MLYFPPQLTIKYLLYTTQDFKFFMDLAYLKLIKVKDDEYQ